MNETEAPLTIGKDHVVMFHYAITNADGEELEATRGEEPQAVLLGHGAVLHGVETALLGRHAGEDLTVTLDPADTYGERRENWTQRVSKKYLPKGPLRPGMTVRLNTEQGPRTVTIVKVGNKVVDVDLNHPFAGELLTFNISIVGVRAATVDELAHGHAHGPGGHQH